MPEAIRISKEVINAMPLLGYEGPIEIVGSDEALEQAIEHLRQETILGFDTESRPAFRKGQSFPVSLIQLAGEKKVWLFQVGKITHLAPLWDILADPGLLKVGVAIADDIKKLRDLHPFDPAGFIEIGNLSQKAGILNTGLRSLTGLLLNFRISKRAQVSNWARSDLTEAQIQYAATDAWVSRLLYFRMVNLKREDIPPVPAPPGDNTAS
ncbi:MAG: hypothetical protein RL648_707 [Verrucomicrobiota bacterium]|jgi:ribonuclease D